MQRIYKSKIGWEFFVLFAVILTPQVVLSFFNSVTIYGVLVLLVIALFIVFTFNKTMYVIDGACLTVKSSVFYKKVIAIKTIRKVVETRNPISSPAASLDRLEVYFDKFDSVIISPKKKMNL
jgi:Bacterial PH domain